MARQLWIPYLLTEFGVKTAQVPGWQTRGSESFYPKGVVCHHTASNANGGDTPALKIVTYGRSDLPGPLAQILLARSGTAHIVAAGRANHAGSGGYHGLSGNSSVFGIEAENNGIGEPWPHIQLEAYSRICAALCWHMGRGAEWICGHKEWAPRRKIDPRGIDMNWFRVHVQDLIEWRRAGGPFPPL